MVSRVRDLLQTVLLASAILSGAAWIVLDSRYVTQVDARQAHERLQSNGDETRRLARILCYRTANTHSERKECER